MNKKRRWITLLMQGFGVGLSPFAPGTCGTLLAIPLFWGLCVLPLQTYMLIVFMLFAVGVYGCKQATIQIGIEDHRSLVWDEIVGFLVTMTLIPFSVVWVVLGFFLFRIFDILKPWPIGWIDQKIKGGLGVMLDDFLAGIYANVLLQILLRFL